VYYTPSLEEHKHTHTPLDKRSNTIAIIIAVIAGLVVIIGIVMCISVIAIVTVAVKRSKRGKYKTLSQLSDYMGCNAVQKFMNALKNPHRRVHDSLYHV
jgi:hypothetical protein